MNTVKLLLKLLFFAGFLASVSSVALADRLYEDYDNYYASIPNHLFNPKKRHEFQIYSLYPDPAMRLYWEGKVDQKHYFIDLFPRDSDTLITIDGHTFKLNSAYIFPGEFADMGTDLGDGAGIYFSKQYACIDQVPPTASGSSDRHLSVYLIDMRFKPYRLFKLPGLFASCIGIRLNAQGIISFDDVDYWYRKNREFPSGVIFTEYAIKDTKFIPTGKKVTATFMEPEDVFRFIIGK